MVPSPVIALLLTIVLTAVGLTGCGEDSGQESLPPLPTASDLTVQLVTANLDSPVFMTAPPNDPNRLFVIEKQGLIRIFNIGNSSLATFLDLTSLVSTNGERGLLGMAFDAQYTTNRQFYVFYTDPTGDIVIARYLRNAVNANVADPGGTTLLTIEHSANTNHNGGMLVFGADGCLYAAVGDGGGAGDQNNNGQSLTTKLGKLLRLDPNTGGACTIGGINPFILIGGLQELWSLGLRNPWRFSFDRQTGDLYIGDVGQGAREEINVSLAPNAGRQANYGWRLMEGFICFNPATNCNQGGLTLPVLDYPHLSGACSVTGGYVYRGSTVPALSGLRGTYFYADFCNGFVRSFRYQNGQVTNQFEWPLLNRTGITSFGEDAQGELYLMTQGGSLYKIIPN
jgi:glucose/arabinose dehydrogenase